MTTATHTDHARAVADVTGWDLDDFAADHEWSAVGLGPVGRHRDSGCLERSNFDVVYADLRERFGDAIASPRFGHWGHGWIDEIAFDAGREDVAEEVQRWEAALADYPVADEMAFSELEYAEACESIGDATWWLPNGMELCEDAPEGWAGDLFSALSDRGCSTDPDGMRAADVAEAAAELGLLAEEA